MFLRRLGQNSDRLCSSGWNCPQILEMSDGSYAAVGEDIRQMAAPAMPPGPGVGPAEGVVRIPREVMIAAMRDVLSTV